ncbi:mitochondrial 54S ribosomal protein uL2m [Limtongia smithiae]|uniref:mitochondrial 54S ribosomal protein uL2m n=1 Tax=Limtongia smithiae TaxID=1125753 RepID=UPI0034CDBDDB
MMISRVSLSVGRALRSAVSSSPVVAHSAQREMHSTAVLFANNMPKKTNILVSRPKNTTLAQLGLDTSRKVEVNTLLAASRSSEDTDAGLELPTVADDIRVRRADVRTVELKKYKPMSPGLRWYRKPIHRHLWKGRPLKQLTVAKRKTGGRNNTGRLTARNVGGGHKRRLRIIDYARSEPGQQTVIRIEYDPGRTSHIALVSNDETNKLSYIVAADGLRSGDKVESFRAGIPADLLEAMAGQLDPALMSARTNRRGNCMPLRMIPVGTVIHCIGQYTNGPGVLCRAAGAFGRLLSKNEAKKQAIIRLKSGEERILPIEACATIGIASNPQNQFLSLGKAGRSRWLGRRPHVRGMAMNANEHPHGGGRGKSKGNVPSQSEWGVLAKGYKTRRGKNINKWKVRDRPRGLNKSQPLLTK